MSNQGNQNGQEQARPDMITFRPPILRSGTATLNRALFNQTINLAAASVHDQRHIAKYRKALESNREILKAERISPIRPDPDQSLASQGRKCLLLHPSVKADAPTTWGAVLRDGVQKQELTVIPYDLQLDYDYWGWNEVLASIIPLPHDDLPGGFNAAGHVAHLNLRDQFLPYKKLIAEVLLDKTPSIKTVINKINNVGADSEFRTFQYEVLAGPDDLNVQVSENNCIFDFDYSKVYWNSKLEYEHRRLINLFKPGEVVCDVMAGIGPFAVPAGKKHVHVWANDKNPESFKCLEAAVRKNKVGSFVRPFCLDGRDFIRRAADDVLAASRRGDVAVVHRRPRRTAAAASQQVETEQRFPVPPTIAHFVMNLPASAIEFLGCYRGLYAGHEALFAPAAPGGAKLPMVHVHCFSVRPDDETRAHEADVCERIARELGYPVRVGDPEEGEGRVALHEVRNVAPNKFMYCASFRLPREVAFAERS